MGGVSGARVTSQFPWWKKPLDSMGMVAEERRPSESEKNLEARRSVGASTRERKRAAHTDGSTSYDLSDLDYFARCAFTISRTFLLIPRSPSSCFLSASISC